MIQAMYLEDDVRVRQEREAGGAGGRRQSALQMTKV